MVCLGNICRSPLAEGILRHKAKEAGIACRVDSAGTGSWHIGNPPHPLSQKVAAQHGIDLSMLRGRQFCPEDLENFDHIYFMDADNLADARKIAGSKWDATKTSLLLDHLPNVKEKNVSDPYFGGFEGYKEVFDLISEACEKIVEKMANFDKKT
jgi:protein-tyrosine phosphatase